MALDYTYCPEHKCRKFIKWDFTYKNKTFHMHTGMTARKVLSMVPLSSTYIRDEAQKTVDIIKNIFPYYIYTNKPNRNGEMNIPNDSFICFYNFNDTKARHLYIKVRDIYEHDLNWFIHNVSHKLGTANAAMSFCTYYKMNCKKKYIFSINALVLDVDCLNTDEQFVEGTEKWCVQKIIEEEHLNINIPVPTYIEEGRQFRYIYVLQEPIYVGKHEKTIKFAQKIMNTFADRLKYLGGDKQQLNSFVRMEGSANVKGWAGHVDHEVMWYPFSDYKYSFQEIIDEFMPKYNYKTLELDEDGNLIKKEKFPENKGRKKKYNKVQKDYAEHNKGMLSFLCHVQDYYNRQEDYGHRENLCFAFRNYAYLSTNNPEKAKEMMLEFNQRFKKPLLEKAVLSATNNVNYRRYYYRFVTLERFLDVYGIDIGYKFNTTEDRKKYKHDYYEKNKKKFFKNRAKKTQKIRDIITELKKLGKKNKEIVVELAKKKITLSIKSVERYITNLRKEGILCPT